MKTNIFIFFILLAAICFSFYQVVYYNKKASAVKIELTKTDSESEDDTEGSENEILEYLNTNLFFTFSNFFTIVKYEITDFSTLPQLIYNILTPPPKV
ncbi:MAG TPA: hypothetical protein VN026_01910 [Bacteroidia bacterium]|nr:hypothetical protein [Bacteroidia bacterium]